MKTSIIEAGGLPSMMIRKIKFHFVLVISTFVLFAADLNVQRLSAQPTSRMEERGFVYTADERGNSVSVIDLSTGQVRTIPVRITPQDRKSVV